MRADERIHIPTEDKGAARSTELADCLEARGSCCAPAGVSLAVLRVFDGAGVLVERSLSRVFGRMVAGGRKGRS